MKRFFQIVVALVVILAVVGGVLYSQDPLYWQRTAVMFTNTDPAHMDFRPTEKITGNGAYQLPLASDAERTIPLEALAAAEAYAADFDSFALIIVHQGFVQTEWYGPGWERDRITQSQSMHKSVAALMVGAAIEDGFIASVDTPIEIYLPEWKDDARGDITIENLMHMSSGLEHFPFALNPFAAKSSFQFLNSSNRLPSLLSAEKESQPGEKFDYNDINAALIGVIIERVTGKRYADYLEEKFWGPMGGQTAEIWLDSDNGLAMTACCLLAPAMDWARLGMMMKDRGQVNARQVISAEWIDAMLTPSPLSDRYGYFTWLGNDWETYRDHFSETEHTQSEPFMVDDIFMFLGRGGQRVFVSRQHDLIIVRLGPHTTMNPLKKGWDNAFLINTIIRAIERDSCLTGFC